MTPLTHDETYLHAMETHGNTSVRVDLTVAQLCLLVTTMQLALRHPYYPEALAQTVEHFIREAIDRLTQLSPVLGATLEEGNHLRREATP